MPNNTNRDSMFLSFGRKSTENVFANRPSISNRDEKSGSTNFMMNHKMSLSNQVLGNSSNTQNTLPRKEPASGSSASPDKGEENLEKGMTTDKEKSSSNPGQFLELIKNSQMQGSKEVGKDLKNSPIISGFLSSMQNQASGATSQKTFVSPIISKQQKKEE